jgi:hypothetical protein
LFLSILFVIENQANGDFKQIKVKKSPYSHVKDIVFCQFFHASFISLTLRSAKTAVVSLLHELRRFFSQGGIILPQRLMGKCVKLK